MRVGSSSHILDSLVIYFTLQSYQFSYLLQTSLVYSWPLSIWMSCYFPCLKCPSPLPCFSMLLSIPPNQPKCPLWNLFFNRLPEAELETFSWGWLTKLIASLLESSARCNSVDMSLLPIFLLPTLYQNLSFIGESHFFVIFLSLAQVWHMVSAQKILKKGS